MGGEYSCCLIEIWPHIEKLFNYCTGAKLSFFKFTASKVEPFLTAYQSNNPMIPFMYHDLKKLINSLLELFVKPEVLAVKKTSKEMQEIDLDDKTNLLDGKNVVVGFGVETIFKDLRIKDLVTSSVLKNFKEGVQIFLVIMLKGVH